MIGSTYEQRKELRRMIADRVIDGRSERIEPKVLCDLDRFDESARQLFRGLEQHYMECVLSGRLAVWGNTAHAIIDLLVSDQIPFVRRADIPDFHASDQTAR